MGEVCKALFGVGGMIGGDRFGLGRSDGKRVGWFCLSMCDSVWNSCEKVERGLDTMMISWIMCKWFA